MNNNAQIKNYELFKTKLETVITTSGQDIGAIYFIMKDVYDRVEKTYYQQVQQELNAERQAQAKAEAQKDTKEEDDATKESE